MINLQITQLTSAMTMAADQAATILHQVLAPQGSWETLAEAIQEVQEMLAPERMIWVAMIHEEVIGWIGGVPQYDGNVWELHPLVVKPAWQRQGIGTRLVRHFEQQVQERGGFTISLCSDDKHNQTSLAGIDLYDNLWEQIRTIRNLNRHPYEFYQKLGYIIIGVMPDAAGCGKPDIMMGKRIG
ncbi:MAG: GNAT family N-acetyltransferase [Caldilineaceae bacterium]|nr:GNAT family N-acetyltransferase [Caldilineaceae bacterium]